ncbi:MAG: FkbM family methyltransferase [Phycisphaerales bacterium]
MEAQAGAVQTERPAGAAPPSPGRTVRHPIPEALAPRSTWRAPLLAARAVHRALRYRLRLNPHQIRAMNGLLPRAGVGIDVGAHKGAYSCWMAWRVGPQGRVLAFEPQDRLAPRTAQSLRALGLRQVRLFHSAVSDRCGSAAIAVRRSSTHGASMEGIRGDAIDQQPVAIVSLDAVAAAERLPRVDFIKIDVEGHEMAVLRGASRILERFGPALLIELEARHHAGGDPTAAAMALLAPLGYRGYFFDRGGRRPIEGFSAAGHQRYGEGAYCNDFLFVRA